MLVYNASELAESVGTEPSAGAADREGNDHRGLPAYESWEIGRLSRARGVQKVTFGDGSVYSGEVEEGRKSGEGILFAPDGSVYLGEWLNDTYHGEGVYIYADGERYEGALEFGEKCGFGKMFYINGDRYDG